MLLAQEANRDLTGICIFIAILNSVNKNWYYFYKRNFSFCLQGYADIQKINK